MTTAYDVITAALRKANVLASREVPTAAMAQQCLQSFNWMLESWSLEERNIYAMQYQTFTWPANEATRTIGPTGDFVGTRPVMLGSGTYYVDGNNVSYIPMIINQEQYATISVKNIATSYPVYLWYNPTFPNATMTLYPIPNADRVWNFASFVVLDTPATLDTELSFPLGYERAFVYNLAMEIGPDFGIEVPASVVRIAGKSLAMLKAVNDQEHLLIVPSNILGIPDGAYNIWTDSYQ